MQEEKRSGNKFVFENIEKIDSNGNSHLYIKLDDLLDYLTKSQQNMSKEENKILIGELILRLMTLKTK